jgi:hypothetical protein
LRWKALVKAAALKRCRISGGGTTNSGLLILIIIRLLSKGGLP